MNKRNSSDSNIIVKKSKSSPQISIEQRSYPTHIRSTTTYTGGLLDGRQTNYSDQDAELVESELNWNKCRISDHTTFWDSGNVKLIIEYSDTGELSHMLCHTKEGVLDWKLNFNKGQISNETSYIMRDGEITESYEDYLIPPSSKCYKEDHIMFDTDEIISTDEQYPSGNIKSMTKTNNKKEKHGHQYKFADNVSAGLLEFNIWKNNKLIHRTCYWKDNEDYIECELNYSNTGLQTSGMGFTTTGLLEWIKIYDEQGDLSRKIDYFPDKFENYNTNIKCITKYFNDNIVTSEYNKSGNLISYEISSSDGIPIIKINNLVTHSAIYDFYQDRYNIKLSIVYYNGMITCMKDYYRSNNLKKIIDFRCDQLWNECEYGDRFDNSLNYEKFWSQFNGSITPFFEKSFNGNMILHKKWYTTGELKTIYTTSIRSDIIINHKVYYKNGVVKYYMDTDRVKGHQYINTFYDNSQKKSIEVLDMEGTQLSKIVYFRKD